MAESLFLILPSLR